jgi:hypothetical protein
MKASNLLIPIMLLFVSCSQQIEISTYFDSSKPFQLNSRTLPSQEISIESEQYQLFLDWLSKNNRGWHSSPASHHPDLSVTQGNFRLLFGKDSEGVVVSFTDKNGEPQQFAKSIKEGELHFLLE